MNLPAFAHRSRWLNLPGGLLMLMLQRAPAPMLRVLVQLESLAVDGTPALLRSGLALAAMGTYNSVAGATVFNVSPATPGSGAANSTFTVTGTTGTALTLGISVSGAPGNPKSWSVKSTTPLPAGLSVTGGNPVNVTAPYKMTIAGTPTAAGNTSVTVTAWDGLNGTGGNSAKITVTFNITGGAVNTAPTITTQPGSLTVTTGGSATFTVAASGSPAPTYQWQKGGADIAGATNTTFSLSNVQSTDAGNYTAVATNVAGTATSSLATLTVQAAPPANVAPTITSQPGNQTVTAGGSATFTIAASGTPTPTYQWQKGGVNIAGATSATLSLSNVQSTDAGNYTAVATNVAGTATSSIATLTVQAAPPANTAPVITIQPGNLTVTAGGSATFTVAASGNPAPTYQWQKSGVNIAGATSATLSLSNVQSTDAGNYTAVATNVAGTATSSIATLTVQAAPPTNTAPIITTQPGNLTVTAGGAATFTVAASGNPAPTYQWQKSGVNIAGATTATLSLSSVQSADAGNYTAVATNSAGSAISAIATLTVQAATPANTAPSITTQPGSLTVTTGGSATFTVAATGSPTPAFQWQKGGVDIAGATGSSFTVAAVTTGDAGIYTVRVSNTAGSVTSANATLTVNAGAPAGPAITTPLSAQSVTTGHSISFTAQSLSGTYQWQVSTDNGVSWANLANNGTYNGVGGPTLIITGATAQMNGMLYRYVVTDGSGSTASNAATLSVAGVFFPNPTGIALVGTAGLYLSDATTDTVQLVTAAGEVTLVAGASGTAGTLDGPGPGALFNQPGGLAADSSGTVYVADTANATIRRLGADGSVTTLAGSTTLRGNTDGSASQATFSAPLGLALDRAGNLYVADSTNHTIRKITPLGAVSTLAGSAGLAGSANGTGPDARFNSPSGLAVDATGNVFVADRTNNLIRRITPAGVVTTLAGTAGISGTDDGTGSAALFNQPSGLALDSAGNLYVADTGNCTIRRITPAGLVSTLAGLPTVGGDQDGTGFGALFNQPRALAVDGAGNLYVADTGNASIRFVTPGGTVTTVTLRAGAASPAAGGSGGTGTGGGSGSSGATGTTPATGTIPAGGGGALSDWFVGSLGLLSLLRWWQHRARTAG